MVDVERKGGVDKAADQQKPAVDHNQKVLSAAGLRLLASVGIARDQIVHLTFEEEEGRLVIFDCKTRRDGLGSTNAPENRRGYESVMVVDEALDQHGRRDALERHLRAVLKREAGIGAKDLIKLERQFRGWSRTHVLVQLSGGREVWGASQHWLRLIWTTANPTGI
jgi:hypothetical protein